MRSTDDEFRMKVRSATNRQPGRRSFGSGSAARSWHRRFGAKIGRRAGPVEGLVSPRSCRTISLNTRSHQMSEAALQITNVEAIYLRLPVIERRTDSSQDAL